MSRRATALALAAALMLLCCVGCAEEESGPLKGLEGRDWKVLELRMPNGGLSEPGGSLATLRLDGGKARGSGGVNGFGGDYTATSQELRFGELASTLMAGDPASMDVETAYLAALRATRRYRLESGSLQLLDADGSLLVRLAPGDAAPSASPGAAALEGVDWVCTGYSDNLEAVVSVAPTGAIVARFVAGKLAGDTGANTYSATYSIDGETIAIGAVTTTELDGPAQLMEQESAYLAALAKATVFEVEDGTLALSAHGGATLLTFVSSEASSSASMP